MPFELQTATFSWDDTGFVSPADNGAPYLNIPAGKFVEIALILAEQFDQQGEIDAYLCPDPSTSGAQMGNYRATAPSGTPPASLEQLQWGNATGFQYNGSGGPTGFTIVPCVICLGFYPDSIPPSQGFGTLIAKIYS